MSGQIFKKMSQVMGEIGSIGKDKTNSAQGFKFRGIDQFLNTLYPALVKNEVFTLPKVLSSKEEIREVPNKSGGTRLEKHVSLMVEYAFVTTDGSSVTVGPIASEGIDSGDKATNKALSAALKYALIQTFSVPTEDMVDGDSDSPVIERSATKATTSGTLTANTDKNGNTSGTVTLNNEGATQLNGAAKTKPSFRKPVTKAATSSEDLI